MGATTHYGVTLNQAIASELDSDVKVIARGAGGGDYSAAYGGWQGAVWMVATKPGWDAPALTCILWTRGPGCVTIKWVSEDMGPGYHDVPDNVWNARPDEAPGEFAIEWRRAVEAFRAKYTTAVRSLGAEDEGKAVLIHGHDQTGPWTYLGERQVTRRSTVKLFRSAEGNIYRLPRSEEQLRRCAVVSADALVGAK